MNPGIFQQLLTALQGALQPGLGAMRPYILGLFAFLAFLEVTRLAAAMAMGADDIPRMVIRFLLKAGVLLWVVLDFPVVVNLIYTSFVQLGLVAGGNALTVAQFLDPGTYLSTGLRVGDVLYQAVMANMGPWSLPMALFYIVAWVFFIIAFGIMGLSVFILQIEFTLAIIASLVLLPFAVLGGTGWIAQGAISYPINVGFRFFVLALLSSVVFPLLTRLTATTATMEAGLVMVMAAWMIAFLFLKGPGIAAGILSGSPSLSAGQVIQAVAGTAVTGAALAATGGMAAGMGARGAMALGSGAARAIGGAQTAYTMGSAGTVGSGAAQVMGGVRAVGAAGMRAIGSSAASPFRATAAQIASSMQRGRVGGWVHTGGTAPRSFVPSAHTATRHPSPTRALQDVLSKSARYFGHDHPHGGAHADLD